MTGTAGGFRWHHTGIAVSDIDKAVEFYSTTLGFEVAFEARGMTDLIQSITGVPGLSADLIQCVSPLGDQVLEFIQFSGVPENAPDILPIRPGRVHTAYLVPDINAAVDATEQAGGYRLGRITEFAEGWAVYCADGAGNVIEWEEAKEEGA